LIFNCDLENAAVLGGTFAACVPGYSQIGDKCYTVKYGADI
jgi:hypothetical protein